MLLIRREPLLHFLLMGMAIFAIHTYLNPSVEAEDGRTVVVDEPQLLTYLQYRSRAFDEEHFRGVLDNMSSEQLSRLARDYIREEVLFREAQSMALGRNDYVARLRLVQQLEFLLRGFADVDTQPADAAVQSYWQENQSDYRESARVTFTHIFFSHQRGGDEAKKRAEGLLNLMEQTPVSFEQAASHGDRFLYYSNYVDRSHDMVASHFGAPLADAVFALDPDPDSWRGPVRSAHGYHLVLLSRRQAETLPLLAELRNQVEQDARDAIVEEKVEALISALVADYSVDVSRLRERLHNDLGS